MRLADVVFRRGHLSDAALVEVWSTGVRPAHLDRCEICAERALETSHWLEDVKALGQADVDAVFTNERLSAQRGQILQRLEQLDRPAKVISFPARKTRRSDAIETRRVSPGWLAAAAAAGLTIGVIGVEFGHSLGIGVKPPQLVQTTTPPHVPDLAIGPEALGLYDDPYSRVELGSVSALDDMTPRLISAEILASNR